MTRGLKAALVRFFHRALIALVSNEQDQYLPYWQWRWIDWTGIGPPWRMSGDELACYAGILRTRRQARPSVLILGATPALRILAAQEDARVVCVDFSMPMLERMGKFVDERVPRATEREVWVRGDWLSAPLPENHFDFVFGDNVLLFLAPQEREILLGRTRDVLKPGGIAALRTHVVDESLLAVPAERHINRFLESRRAADDRSRSISFLNVKMLDWSWNESTGRTNRRRAAEAVRSYLASCRDADSRAFLRAFLDKEERGIDFYFARENDLERHLLRHFRLEAKHYARDYAMPELAPFSPLYVLRK